MMLNYRHNLFVILRTIFGTLRHTDWGYAFRQRGLWGIARALFAGVTGVNSWPFFVQADAVWSQQRLRHLLRARGIASWGWGYHGGQHFFRVRLRQAHWAQYLLLEQGVPLAGRLLEEPAEAMWRGSLRGESRRGSGGQAGSQERAAAPAHAFGFRAQPQPGARHSSSAGDPLDAINRMVDKLAGL